MASTSRSRRTRPRFPTLRRRQLAQARAGVEFAQDGLVKLGDFFGGLPGAVVSTRTVTAPDVVYGSDATVNVAIANKYGRVPAGIATLTINGHDYPVTVAQNAASYTVTGLAAGTYPFTIAYAGDSQVVAFTESGSLTVTKATVGASGTVTKASTPQATGTYSVHVTQPSGLAAATGDGHGDAHERCHHQDRDRHRRGGCGDAHAAQAARRHVDGIRRLRR